MEDEIRYAALVVRIVLDELTGAGVTVTCTPQTSANASNGLALRAHPACFEPVHRRPGQLPELLG
jgi:hypothetical protein